MLQNIKIMKKNRIKLVASLSIIAFSLSMSARENVGGSGITTAGGSQTRSIESGCVPASARVDIDLNNVRATLLTGGDMWWDLISAQYEIPKGSRIKSIFAGSLWIGGIDAGNQLKVAAMTYRQTGNDYWPGPLSSLATTDPATCLQYDKFYKLQKQDVINYQKWVLGGSVGAMPISGTTLQTILEWPTVGPEGQPLAPFFDYNGDNFYDPSVGDYPDFDIVGNRACTARLKGDEAIWWVFNDKGNVHTETGGASIGLEIQAQAFAFQTTDEINDMTFYNYIIANKSTIQLNKTHFGVWVDADLGGYNDDYVGCDVTNGFGYQYNGDAIDEGVGGVLGYGANPPAVGVDFFEGPYKDPNGIADPADSTINGTGYGDTIIDNERLGMERFIYYNNNTNPINGNPTLASNFYNYLTGKWRDNSLMVYGGDAIGSGTPCKFVFPDDSDPTGYGTGGIPQAPWSEWRSNNPFVDRRFMQVAGPFTLKPGAVNVITTGVVWARTTQGGNLASIALLKGADKKAQQLFNNCFKTLDGPTAPDLKIQELNQELILTWTNPQGSNNYLEKYNEDPDLAVGNDSLYRFQGYQLYQVKDATVTGTDLNNVDKARLVLQCDIKDGVKQIVNYTFDPNITANIPQEMVNGADAGIVHSVSVKTDLFASGDNALVNHKTYYYRIVAYGYSSTQEFNPGLFSYNDYKPYISGRKNQPATPYAGIPHIVSPELNGTVQNAGYGSGVKIKRIEGQGNGGNVLDFTDATEAQIVASPTGKFAYPIYDNGHGPVSVKVVDPLNIPKNDYRIRLYDPTTATVTTPATASTITQRARWILYKLSGPGGTPTDSINSDTTILVPNEQIINGQASGSSSSVIPKWGISINVVFAYDPGASVLVNPTNSNLSDASSMIFKDDSHRWLTGLPDAEGEEPDNWIRAGTATYTDNPGYNDFAGIDDEQGYEKYINGTWAPYRLCAPNPAGAIIAGSPAWNQYRTVTPMGKLASVDIIFTSDRSKWTRCPVIELQENSLLAIGGAPKMSMRRSPSVDKDGHKAGDAGYNATEGGMTDSSGTLKPTPSGMGWFPGYAVNLETGERLNMAFGEDSYLPNDNGTDMKWNPTSSLYSASFDPLYGGKHYIYVFGHNANARYAASDAYLANRLKDVPAYDNGWVLYSMFHASDLAGGTAGDAYKREVYTDAMWTGIPLLAAGHSLLETDVKVRLRVVKSYQKYGTGTPVGPTALVVGQNYYVDAGPVSHNSTTYPTGTSFTAVNNTYTTTTVGATVLSTVNMANGLYEFNTSDIQTLTNNSDAAKDALAIINIVPNPYYAYSDYEKTTLDNIVKITNLPAKCTIKIYTMNGDLVRTFKKDDSGAGAEAKTSLDWDLKNEARIPIASGMYLIHVDVPNVGEKILKWFGVLRPIDIEAY